MGNDVNLDMAFLKNSNHSNVAFLKFPASVLCKATKSLNLIDSRMC